MLPPGGGTKNIHEFKMHHKQMFSGAFILKDLLKVVFKNRFTVCVHVNALRY